MENCYRFSSLQHDEVMEHYLGFHLEGRNKFWQAYDELGFSQEGRCISSYLLT